MKIATQPAGPGLDPETVARIRELFHGRTCRRCGGPAVRLSGDQYYCATHFPGRQRRAAAAPRVFRVATC